MVIKCWEGVRISDGIQAEKHTERNFFNINKKINNDEGAVCIRQLES